MAKQKRFYIISEITMGISASDKKKALIKAKELLNKFKKVLETTEVIDIKLDEDMVNEIPF